MLDPINKEEKKQAKIAIKIENKRIDWWFVSGKNHRN